MIKYSVDRLEENIVVLVEENGTLKDVSKYELPQVREGDILLFDGETYLLDLDETEKKRQESQSLIDTLFQ